MHTHAQPHTLHNTSPKTHTSIVYLETGEGGRQQSETEKVDRERKN